MAVSLPVIVLIYELLKSSCWTSWNALLSWTRLDAAPALIGGAITAFYGYSKIGKTQPTLSYRVRSFLAADERPRLMNTINASYLSGRF